MSVRVWFDDFMKGPFLRGTHPGHDVLIDIVVDRRGPEAVSSPMVFEGRHEVQHIDHDWNDCADTLVDRGDRPGCPAPFRRSGDYEIGKGVAV